MRSRHCIAILVPQFTSNVVFRIARANVSRVTTICQQAYVVLSRDNIE
jgi:hypothetical protein